MHASVSCVCPHLLSGGVGAWDSVPGYVTTRHVWVSITTVQAIGGIPSYTDPQRLGSSVRGEYKKRTLPSTVFNGLSAIADTEIEGRELNTHPG